MDNYMDLANKYLARKESKKINVFREMFGEDYSGNMRWNDEEVKE